MGKYDTKFYVAKDSFSVDTVGGNVADVSEGSIWFNRYMSCTGDVLMFSLNTSFSFRYPESFINEHFTEVPSFPDTFNDYFRLILKQHDLFFGGSFRITKSTGFSQYVTLQVTNYKGSADVLLEGEPLLSSGYLCSKLSGQEIALEEVKVTYNEELSSMERIEVAGLVSKMVGRPVMSYHNDKEEEDEFEFYVMVGEEVVAVSVYPKSAKLQTVEEFAERVARLFKGEWVK